jgi:hypothetical protein
VYTVALIEATVFRITLSSAYTGLSEEDASVCNQPRTGYQYIVTFNSNLGDLPSLKLDGLLLCNSTYSNGTAMLTSCDRLKYQVVQMDAPRASSATPSI